VTRRAKILVHRYSRQRCSQACFHKASFSPDEQCPRSIGLESELSAWYP
jgi:hypothetical protein